MLLLPSWAGNAGGPMPKIGVVTGGARGVPGLAKPGKAPTDAETVVAEQKEEKQEHVQETQTETEDPPEAEVEHLESSTSAPAAASSIIPNLEAQAAALELSTPPTPVSQHAQTASEESSLETPSLSITSREEIRTPLPPDQQPETPQLDGEELPVLNLDTPAEERGNAMAGIGTGAPPLGAGNEGPKHAQQEKVFKGFGPDRHYGKIGVPVPPTLSLPSPSADDQPPLQRIASQSPSPSADSAATEDFSSKWGTREGLARLPSPGLSAGGRSGAVSPAMSATNSADGGSDAGGEKKKVPIWMRKGGE